jgi:hypothetical protein
MSKQVYEVRGDKTMDWGKRLRYSVNYASSRFTPHPLTQVCQRGRFSSRRNEGNLGPSRRPGLPPTELPLLKLPARPQRPVD